MKDFTQWQKLKTEIESQWPEKYYRETVILSQIRTLSSKRLVRRMGHISEEDFNKIEERVIDLIKETDPSRGPQVPFGNLK